MSLPAIRPATPDTVRDAAALLRRGRLVAFPTETVYGLGANALDPTAVAEIFAVKGRPTTNPLIVHIADPSQVPSVADEWPDTACQLAARFWPGPLTMVVRKSTAVPDGVTGGGPTVAVRCPAHPVARALIAHAGVPIAAPSANRSGELSPTTAEHVLNSLGGTIDLIIDGGPCPGGLESTVVSVIGGQAQVLRPGLISTAQLEAVLGQMRIGVLVESASAPLLSPGMLTRHYAPRTRVECVESPAEAETRTHIYETAGLRVCRWIPIGTVEHVSTRLYADLHTLDSAGYDRILVVLPPNVDEWQAVRDRLTRASAEE